MTLTAAQAMDCMEAVATVLKVRFNNLSATELAALSKECVKSVMRVLAEDEG